MKKNHRKLLPLFLVLPFLAASYNGPNFYVHNLNYYDLEYASHEQVGEDYIYTCNFKNSTGVYLTSIELSGEIDDESYYLSLEGHSFSHIFYEYVVGPGYEGTVTLTSKKEIPDINKLHKDGEGFTVSDTSIEKAYASTDIIENIFLFRTKSEDHRFYSYKIALSPDFIDKYAYGLYELTYDGDTFYQFIDRYSDGYLFYTYQEIDLTKLKVEGVTFIEQYRPFSPSGDGLLYVSLIVIGVLLLFHAAIFLAVFFFVRFLIRKNRKAKADLAQ